MYYYDIQGVSEIGGHIEDTWSLDEDKENT